MDYIIAIAFLAIPADHQALEGAGLLDDGVQAITELREELARVGAKVAVQECLQDSAYQAGAKFGWNCGVCGDEERFRQATSSSEHIAELRRIKSITGDTL